MMDSYAKIISELSRLRREPEWMLNWRMNAYYCFVACGCPKWSEVGDCEARANACFDVSREAQDVAFDLQVTGCDVDVVYDASSIYLNMTKELRSLGILFTSLARAVLLYPKLVRRYLGSVVFQNDNYFAALNSSLFTDGTFVRIPRHVNCPINLSTYFRITSGCVGQFERTLVVLDADSCASYFEGCNSSRLDRLVLHAAVVELVVWDRSSLKYTTLQNWASGGSSGVHNLVTKRALCAGYGSKVVWVQIEIGASLTWKYPSSVLYAKASRSEFYSLSISNGQQRVDTGTKCYHLSRGTSSSVLAKAVVLGSSFSLFRALISMKSELCRSHIRCDALLASELCTVRALPMIEAGAWPCSVEYESVNSYITAQQLKYCEQRGLSFTDAVRLVVNGYAQEIVKRLPLEAALEVTKLLFV
ncbi:MAG: SufD family Fe-S cluster assembly protein [Candidatus Hodgkinia cicadicola]